MFTISVDLPIWEEVWCEVDKQSLENRPHVYSKRCRTNLHLTILLFLYAIFSLYYDVDIQPIPSRLLDAYIPASILILCRCCKGTLVMTWRHDAHPQIPMTKIPVCTNSNEHYFHYLKSYYERAYCNSCMNCEHPKSRFTVVKGQGVLVWKKLFSAVSNFFGISPLVIS